MPERKPVKIPFFDECPWCREEARVAGHMQFPHYEQPKICDRHFQMTMADAADRPQQEPKVFSKKISE